MVRFLVLLLGVVAAQDLQAQVAELRHELEEQKKMLQDLRLGSIRSCAEEEKLRHEGAERHLQATNLEALQSIEYGLGGALDSAWLCLCGALAAWHASRLKALASRSCSCMLGSPCWKLAAAA